MTCACPRTDARDCMRERARRDLGDIRDAFNPEAPPPYEAEELCDCGCHERGEDDDVP